MKWWHSNFLQSEMEATSPLFLLLLFLLTTFNFKILILYAQEFLCVKILNVKNYSERHLAFSSWSNSAICVFKCSFWRIFGFNIRSHTLLSVGSISYIFLLSYFFSGLTFLKKHCHCQVLHEMIQIFSYQRIIFEYPLFQEKQCSLSAAKTTLTLTLFTYFFKFRLAEYDSLVVEIFLLSCISQLLWEPCRSMETLPWLKYAMFLSLEKCPSVPFRMNLSAPSTWQQPGSV